MMLLYKKFITFLFFLSSFFMQGPNLIAEGEDQSLWPTQVERQVILDSFDSALEEAQIEDPLRAKVEYFEDSTMIFHIYEENRTSFITCHLHGKDPHCLALNNFDPNDSAQLAMLDPYEWDIPLQDIKEKKSDAWKDRLKNIALWMGIALTSYYSFKKIINKISRGTFTTPYHQHNQFFKTPHEMEHSQADIEKYLEVIFPLMREKINTDEFSQTMDSIGLHDSKQENHSTRLGEFFKETFISTLKNFQNVRSHHHCDHGDHDCHEAKEDESSINKGIDLMLPFKDFYNETFRRPVDLVRSLFQEDNANQALEALELAAIKNLHEKGMIMAIGNGIVIVGGQIVFEAIESVVLSTILPGAHLFCTTGNAIVLAITAGGYVCYFNIRNSRQIAYLPLGQRIDTISQILASHMKIPRLNYGKIEQFIQYSLTDDILFSLVLIQKSIESQLRFARSMNKITVEKSRQLAGVLGSSRKELSIIYLRLKANALQPWPGNLQEDLLNWLDKMEDIYNQIKNPHAISAHD
ncbi:MAG: hypothetical protein OXB84_06445 [Halobacteriovoraceae bacterium]|nr:hypothetical protein [Halobacteriovoraceae bacterium]